MTLCTFANQQQITRPDHAGEIRDGRHAAFTAIHIGEQLLSTVTGNGSPQLCSWRCECRQRFDCHFALKISGFRQATFYINGTDGLDSSSPWMHLKSHLRRHVVDCDGCTRKYFPNALLPLLTQSNYTVIFLCQMLHGSVLTCCE